MAGEFGVGWWARGVTAPPSRKLDKFAATRREWRELFFSYRPPLRWRGRMDAIHGFDYAARSAAASARCTPRRGRQADIGAQASQLARFAGGSVSGELA